MEPQTQHFFLFLALTRVRMRRDLLNRLIEKYLEQLIDSVRVLQPHCRNVKTKHFKHYCAAACAGTIARHTCSVPRHLMNRCTKYGAIDLFTLECWHGAVLCHLNESSNVFVSFGCIISQTFFRNFTFKIVDYFKCRWNGSSQPQLNRMLEFSLNRPTTSLNTHTCAALQ